MFVTCHWDALAYPGCPCGPGWYDSNTGHLQLAAGSCEACMAVCSQSLFSGNWIASQCNTVNRSRKRVTLSWSSLLQGSIQFPRRRYLLLFFHTFYCLAFQVRQRYLLGCLSQPLLPFQKGTGVQQILCHICEPCLDAFGDNFDCQGISNSTKDLHLEKTFQLNSFTDSIDWMFINHNGNSHADT